jgi:hypothetical protein
MALTIEDGSGVSGANSYTNATLALAYLTDRNRQDENTWADLDANIKDAHLIAAADYIENRFRDCFKGVKEFKNLRLAKNVLTFTTNPVGAATVVIGSRTYTFVATLVSADQVLIGSNAGESLDNLIDAISADPDGEGVTYGTGTLVHDDVSARSYEGDTMIVEALLGGLAGNSIATTTDVPGASWAFTTLQGGADTGVPQPLSFPRLNIFDRDGLRILGIPDRLKFAQIEYAVRSAGGTLLPDPAVASGLQVIEKEEVVGPIKERTKWQEGGRIQISVPYPGADLLLREYIFTGGMVFR